eukprot:CAMPEP_0184494018 /NCGR_PEP_ID=MMETSP0113_2-20130426/27594_1 /TAXON_ID=91329 /ORGANISM="Norrisiella sphaerica, Strain BC52" /LENGTH=719 /DNA_ID=CAMNT_0026879567 /DNA_START=141 /DNA_END=2300 /DNA_ORIENTATION=+
MATIRNSGKKFRFKRDYATVRRLGTNLVLGCRVLHYTGHGLENGLAFEDDCGVMHIVPTETLRELMAAGAKEEEVKLVFVAACHSESTGRAFVEAGVKHVIAVKISEKVADAGARHFMNSFYLSLLMGRTVQNAFTMAVETLKAIPNLPTADDEAKKYLLLPRNADHNVQIFPKLGRGGIDDYTDQLALENLPASVDHFTGRNLEVQRIVEMFVKERKRLITICGEAGIGKTAVAIDAAKFLLHRGVFKDGVIFLRFQDREDLDIESVAEQIAEGMGLEIPTHRICRALNREMRKKEALLIMDGLDSLVAQVGKKKRAFLIFIRELLQDCANLRVLATCKAPIGIERGIEEVEFPLKGMYIGDICKLFYKLTGGRVTAEAVGIEDFCTSNEILEALSKHKLITEIIQGHPYTCWSAAKRFVKVLDLDKVAKQMSFEKMPSSPQNPTAERTPSDGYTVRPSPNTAPRKVEVKEDHAYVYSPVSPNSFNGSDRERKFSEYEKRASEILTTQAKTFWDYFKPELEVSWERFKEHLAFHFKRIAGVQRGLDNDDLQTACVYVQTLAKRRKLSFSHRGLTAQSFQLWWDYWYMPLVRTIVRVRNIWDNGHIMGVSFDKNKIKARIVNGPVGAFMLRMSANNPGCLAMGFVGQDQPKEILHILIDNRRGDFKVKFNNGEVQTYETLEDLILQCKRVTILYPGNKGKHAVFGNAGMHGNEDEDGPS